ncbi:MAG: potassium channel family protein [Acidimicrobiales bacterium]
MEESAEDRLMGRARSAADAKALERFDGLMALPLVLAALLPLVLLPGGNHTVLAAVVNVVAWLVFLVDFVVHERRLRHYLGTWLGRFDLVVVILTAPYFLFIPGAGDSKFVMVIRLARIARLVVAGKGARRLIERVGRVAIVAIGVVLLGAAIAYEAEHPSNPGFATYGDAVWWGIVTLTTVGYGDIVPETTAGRFAGVMIMISGVGVLGVLAGSLASFFRVDSEPKADESGVVSAAPPDQTGELRDQIARLADEVARLASRLESRDGPD